MLTEKWKEIGRKLADSRHKQRQEKDKKKTHTHVENNMKNTSTDECEISGY